MAAHTCISGKQTSIYLNINVIQHNCYIIEQKYAITLDVMLIIGKKKFNLFHIYVLKHILKHKKCDTAF